MKKDDIAELDLPDEPGVYYFIDSDGKVVYVGKATSLRDRVRSYFSHDLIETRGPRIVQMVDEAVAVEVAVTDSVLEAVILEAKEIKRLQPPYNIKDRDNKSFLYVVITQEEFPRILLMRERELVAKGAEIKVKKQFGPFTDGRLLRDALKIIRKIFPYLDRTGHVEHHRRFYQQLGLAPDTKEKKMKQRYMQNIRNIGLFFQGKKGKVVKELEKQMRKAVQEEDFEYAAKLRDKIKALQHINDISLIREDITTTGRDFRIEGYDVAHTAGNEVVGVMTVVNHGDAEKAAYRQFIIKNNPGINDTATLKEVMERRFQLNAAHHVLDSFGYLIPVVAVIKNEQHRPEKIIGNDEYARTYETEIILVNSEAHRFALSFHQKRRGKAFR